MAVKPRNRYPSIERRSNQPQEIVALAEVAEILTGQRGDGLDQAITWRDAKENGLITVIGGPGKWTGFRPTGNGAGTGTGNNNQTVDTPTKPTGVTASGAFTAIYIHWDQPTYSGHAYTEIWRANTDNFGVAVRIGTEIGNVFPDPVGMGATYLYWVRHVNTNGSAGPLNDTHGTIASTAPNISQIMDDLGDKISAGQLSTSLSNRINLIDAPVTGLIAQLAAETAARQQSDGQLQVQIESIVLSNIADVYYQPDMPAGTIAENSRWFDTDDGNHPYLYLNGAWQDVSDQRILDLQAAVVAEQSARLTADTAQADQINAVQAAISNPTTGLSANASAITSLSSSVSSINNTVTAHTNQFSQIQAIVGNNFASLQTISDVSIGPGGLSAQQYIKTDVNGRIAGYGLYNDGATSQFIIRADTFAVAHPSAPTKYPFIIDGGQTYIDMLMVKDGAIQNAKIQSLTADKITAGTLDAARIGTNSLTADKIDTRGLTIKDAFGNIIFGSGNNLDVSRIAGLGALSTLSSVSSALMTAGFSANLLTNAAFKSTSDRWYFNTGGAEVTGNRNFSGWTLTGEGTLYIQQLGSAAQDGYWITDPVAVIPGSRYEAFAYTGAHRCQVNVTVAFYDSSDSYLTEIVAGVNNQEAAGGTTLAGYKKTGGFVTAPANAARARFFVQKGITASGQTSSYAFVSRCFFGEARAAQTELSPWSDGSPWSRFGTLDILTDANISTYMQAAAIGTAQIGIAQIDTLRVQQHAISTHSSAVWITNTHVTANVALTYTSPTLGISFSLAPQNVTLIATVSVQLAGSNSGLVRCQIYRNGTLIQDTVASKDDEVSLETYTFVGIDTPPAGEHSYYLVISNPNSVGHYYVQRTSLLILANLR